MIGVFLGAGFSKWAANLPLASQLFDFELQCRQDKEVRKLAALQKDKERWDLANPGGSAEQFIDWALAQPNPHITKRAIWYVTRRLSDPFVGRMLGGTQSYMIDDRRAREHEGVQTSIRFFTRFLGIGLAGVVTSNYDLLVEYTFGSSGFHYGKLGEELHGRGKNPWFPWQGVPVYLTGQLPLAKLHGSVSWDAEHRYTDGRCGLNGTALVVPPRPGKPAPSELTPVWQLADTILKRTTRLVVFGFAFNSYDANLLDFLRASGKGIRQILLIDPFPKIEAAQAVWPTAEVITMRPSFTAQRAEEVFATHGSA